MPKTRARCTAPLPGQAALIDVCDLPDGAVHTRPDDLADWHATATDAVLTWGVTVATFTSYEVVVATGIPEPPHPNNWGALFIGLHARGLIEPAGYDRSHRKSSASSAVRRWRVVRTFTRDFESPQP